MYCIVAVCTHQDRCNSFALQATVKLILRCSLRNKSKSKSQNCSSYCTVLYSTVQYIVYCCIVLCTSSATAIDHNFPGSLSHSARRFFSCSVDSFASADLHLPQLVRNDSCMRMSTRTNAWRSVRPVLPPQLLPK